VELQNGDPTVAGNEPIYVAGTENFYAITRYNWSSYYAMSVIELGREVARARQNAAANEPSKLRQNLITQKINTSNGTKAMN
jgi:membrane-bound lytic murein transglycosylase B